LLLLDQLVWCVTLSANVPVRSQIVPHTPALQTAVPPLAGHVRPQVPQLLIVLSAVSQPFCRVVSQSPKPVLQLGTQAELAQLVVPCAFVHAAPHAPQCAVVVASRVSQPVATLLSQFANPLVQLAMPQLLALHCGVPFAVAQTLSQKPQSATVFVVLVSQVTARSPSHSARPVAQGDAWHTPATQICPLVPQARPHEPQRAGSVTILASQPFLGLPSQSE
jgi:hypothetical protein